MNRLGAVARILFNPLQVIEDLQNRFMHRLDVLSFHYDEHTAFFYLFANIASARMNLSLMRSSHLQAGLGRASVPVS